MVIRMLAAVAVALLVSACTSLHVISHVPLSSLKRLWSFDVMALDTEGFRVAARLVDTLQPREVKVTIDVKRGGEKRRVEMILVAVTDTGEHGALRGFEKQGYRLHVYRASAADVVRINELRRQMIAGHQGDGPARGASGQIAVSVKACRTAPLQGQALPTTTLMRTDGSGYFVLVDDLDLRSVISTDAFESEVPKCA